MTESKTFIYSYTYKGKKWGFELQARDMSDAHARLLAIREGEAQLDGELKLSFEAHPKHSPHTAFIYGLVTGTTIMGVIAIILSIFL